MSEENKNTSESEETKNTVTEEGAEATAENVTSTENQESEKNTEPSAEDKIAELNDKFVRLYAEFDNFRRRTNKEKVDIIANASAGVLKDMLPIMDDFERAIANNEQVDDVQALKEGFTLIYNKLKSTLESKGLKPMQAKGEVFDSEFHEAIANIPAPDDSLKGKVVDDVEKGYVLNDKVIRFAKVVVGQ